MKKEQRNKKTMIIALLILAVVVTGTLIGTMAKYVTSSSSSDDAVAAKFGLDTAHTINLFSDSYTNVKADTNGKKIIAPGTTGYYNFEVTGKSEVAYKVNADIKVEYSEEWGDYEPLEFSVNGTEWTTLEEFQTDLSDALASEILLPNTEYSSNQAIHWRWLFHTSDANDIEDTKMGIAAATGTAPEVTVTINMTAAQVD